MPRRPAAALAAMLAALPALAEAAALRRAVPSRAAALRSSTTARPRALAAVRAAAPALPAAAAASRRAGPAAPAARPQAPLAALSARLAPALASASDDKKGASAAHGDGRRIEAELTGAAPIEADAVSAQSAAVGFGAGWVRSPAQENPSVHYAAALKEARGVAERHGLAGELRFVRATAGLPMQGGRRWSYLFAAPREDARHDLIYVDFERSMTDVVVTARASLYRAAPLPPGARPAPAEAAVPASLAAIGPERALAAARAAGLSGPAGVELDAEGGELWYRFHSDRGGRARVNARTGEVELEQATPAPGAPLRRAVGALRSLLARMLE